MLVRRPGCWLCREEAVSLSKQIKPQLKGIPFYAILNQVNFLTKHLLSDILLLMICNFNSELEQMNFNLFSMENFILMKNIIFTNR